MAGWVAAAGAIIGGLLSSRASSSAAGAQQQASEGATAEQRRQFNISQQNLAPWLNQGRGALYRLSDYLGLQTPLFGGNLQNTSMGSYAAPAGTTTPVWNTAAPVSRTGAPVATPTAPDIPDPDPGLPGSAYYSKLIGNAALRNAGGSAGTTVGQEGNQTFIPATYSPTDPNNPINQNAPPTNQQLGLSSAGTPLALRDTLRSIVAPAVGYNGGFGTGDWQQYLASRGLTDEWRGLQQAAMSPSSALSNSGLPTNVRDALARTLGYTGGFGAGDFSRWLAQTGKQNQWLGLVNQFKGQPPSGTGGTRTVTTPGGGTTTLPSKTFGSLLKPFTGADLLNEPGYQFGLGEGNKAIDRAALARGGWDSGATLKALTRFGQDYAGTKYTDAFNRDLSQKQNIYNMLSGLSGTGQVTGGQIAQLGANTANNIGNAMMAGGNARAAGIVGSANAWNNAIGQGINNYTMMQYLNNQNSGSTPGSWQG